MAKRERSYSCNPYQGCGTVLSVTVPRTERCCTTLTPRWHNALSKLDRRQQTLYGTTRGSGGFDRYGTVFALSPLRKRCVVPKRQRQRVLRYLQGDLRITRTKARPKCRSKAQRDTSVVIPCYLLQRSKLNEYPWFT